MFEVFHLRCKKVVFPCFSRYWPPFKISYLAHNCSAHKIKHNEKSREIVNLNDRLEMLYATSGQIVAEREDIGETVKSTPVIKKRREERLNSTQPPPQPTTTNLSRELVS